VNQLTDQQLLQEYAGSRSEAALPNWCGGNWRK
jgi:hypothetical protein